MFARAREVIVGQYDLAVLELACKMYTENRSKTDIYRYLKSIKLVPSKIAAVMHLVECIKDNEHVVMDNYANYVAALRAAKE